MNEFENRFKLLDNIQLLRIIEEAENYKPDALLAAKSELNKREVSEEDIQQVKSEILEKNLQLEKTKQQIETIKKEGAKILNAVHPIQSKTPSVAKKINWIAGVFGIYSIYQIVKEFEMMGYMITDLSLDMFAYFLAIFSLPVGVFFFWKRKKLGWILMSIYCIHNALNFMILFFHTVKWSQPEEPQGLGEMLDIMEDLFPQPSPLEYFLFTFIYSATFWAIAKSDVRNVFQVDKKSALITATFTTLFTLIFICHMLWD